MASLINFIKKIFSKQETTYRRMNNPRRRVSTESYLLEYRYSGYPKKYILNRYLELNRAYRITHPKHHYVPHITIAGPIVTDNERKLIEELQEIIFKNAYHFHEPGNLVGTGKFIIFDTDIGGKVLAIELKPPKSLVNLKKDIEFNLNKSENFKCQVYKKEIWHTTLWNTKNNFHANKEKFQKVWHNLENNPQEMKFILDRLTLIRNGLILKEFDLVELRVYNRIESLNNNKRYESYLKLKKELESKGESFKSSRIQL